MRFLNIQYNLSWRLFQANFQVILGADHLTLEGWGWVILKKNFLQALVGRKNCMQHKCNRELVGKKGKKYPAHHIARKKILDDQKSPTPTLKS